MSIDNNGQSVVVLGSTGSIGKNTLDVLESSDRRYRILALAANSNYKLLAVQARQTAAEYAVIGDNSFYHKLKNELFGSKIKVLSGVDAIIKVASLGADITMSAIVGIAGLAPTVAAIKQGGKIALANKECLVCAGSLLLDMVKKFNSSLIPVDSEHNAIFQVLQQNAASTGSNIKKIILTASGGPFKDYSAGQLAKVTPIDAVAHPNWSMGNKISVDSATMMNKALELIEAYHLFPVTSEQIEVLIHRQSIIHSMVEYVDGSVLAQLGIPDMRVPISYAIAWPDRIKTYHKNTNLAEIGNLTFEKVDNNKFPAIELARKVLTKKQCVAIAFNAANEVAVNAFLANKIKFTDIIKIVQKVVSECKNKEVHSIDEVLAVNSEIKNQAEEVILHEILNAA